MKLQELIPSERILLDLQVKTVEEVIDRMVGLLKETGAITDHELVKKQVLDREQQVGTGIGYGVAIPHAEPGPFSQPIAAFARLKNPVDFQAPDGKKASLIFMLLTPEKTPALHVRLLARICRLTKSEHRRKRLLEVKSPIEAAATIADLESDYPELTP